MLCIKVTGDEMFQEISREIWIILNLQVSETVLTSLELRRVMYFFLEEMIVTFFYLVSSLIAIGFLDIRHFYVQCMIVKVCVFKYLYIVHENEK